MARPTRSAATGRPLRLAAPARGRFKLARRRARRRPGRLGLPISKLRYYHTIILFHNIFYTSFAIICYYFSLSLIIFLAVSRLLFPIYFSFQLERTIILIIYLHHFHHFSSIDYVYYRNYSSLFCVFYFLLFSLPVFFLYCFELFLPT